QFLAGLSNAGWQYTTTTFGRETQVTYWKEGPLTGEVGVWSTRNHYARFGDNSSGSMGMANGFLNGVGGLGTGMVRMDGTFAFRNGGITHYAKNPATGRMFYGNQYVNVHRMTQCGKWISRGGTIAGVAIGVVEVGYIWHQTGEFGSEAQLAAATTLGGGLGAWGGAKLGALGGFAVGGPIGALIGGIGGGIVGGFGGSWFGGVGYNWFR
ncbi:MAG: hypothetical protein FWD82_11075, partial [Defluviitaleaceae bacterium]|nr:hypothetical protein [Defluviitaleaceae bacterium]